LLNSLYNSSRWFIRNTIHRSWKSTTSLIPTWQELGWYWR